jgi:hypothetical protein
MMCPYTDYCATRYWLMACDICRGSKLISIQCNNPESCQKTLDEAWSKQMISQGWV